MFENEAHGNVIGNAQAPYITSLAKRWANMTNSFGVTHPSQPNYIALFSGSTQGVTSDACPHAFDTTNVASELLASHLTFAGMAESLPRAGFEGCFAHPDQLHSRFLYARKHAPWTNFANVPIVDSLPYRAPLRRPPANFVWITPNMCDDMHDCSIAAGDRWAVTNLPALIAWDAANGGVLVLTFDEDDRAHGNHIPTILAGNVRPGQYDQRIDHYNVLRTILDVFGLRPMANSTTASPIDGVIK